MFLLYERLVQLNNAKLSTFIVTAIVIALMALIFTVSAHLAI